MSAYTHQRLGTKCAIGYHLQTHGSRNTAAKGSGWLVSTAHSIYLVSLSNHGLAVSIFFRFGSCVDTLSSAQIFTCTT